MFFLHCKNLDAYVDQIIEEREKKGQLCATVVLTKSPIPVMTLAAAGKNEYSSGPQKKVAVEYVLFDRQRVVDLLCEPGASIISNEKRFQKILMKKFKQVSDTMTLTMKTSSLLNDPSFAIPPSPPNITISVENDLNSAIQGTNSNSNSMGGSANGGASSTDVPHPEQSQKAIVFSSESSPRPSEESEKSTVVNIASFRSCLEPKSNKPPQRPRSSYRHVASFDTMADRSLQKALDDQKLLSAILKFSDPNRTFAHKQPEQKKPFSSSQFSIFELDLYSDLCCS